MLKIIRSLFLLGLVLVFGITSVHAQRVKNTSTTTSSSTSTNSIVTLISNK